jgi:putative transposase
VMAAEDLPVEACCKVLGVSVSGYYAWLTRPPSERSIRHAWLNDLVSRIHAQSQQFVSTARCGSVGVVTC